MAKKERIEILNRKAGFNFQVEDKYEAGIALVGTEVKSVRNHQVNMGDAYCVFHQDELYLRNMHISEFKNASFATHDPLRDRKLLLTKKELRRLHAKSKNVGYTIFPIRLYENDRGLFKLEIGIGQGKKLHDKRDDMKEKDAKREMERFRK